jgi:cadmium resistance protein CadD (predicted permease)
MGIGVPELLILGVLGVVPVAIGLFAVLGRRRANRFGYPSTSVYLRAAPQSDAEKRDAADLALKGLVFCLLGLLFPPFVLVGLIPLFYGGRKLLYASMGLGLVDDADQPGA